jgi:hypothetical protein
VNNDSEASCYGRAINLSSISVRHIGQIFVGLISLGLSVPMLLANVDWVDKKPQPQLERVAQVRPASGFTFSSDGVVPHFPPWKCLIQQNTKEFLGP